MGIGNDVYRASMKSHKSRLAKLIMENEKCWNSLEGKESEFAKSVKALGDLHRQAYKIYNDAQREMKFEK